VLQSGAQHRERKFNKLYETESLAKILEAQYLDDYLVAASAAAHQCWLPLVELVGSTVKPLGSAVAVSS